MFAWLFVIEFVVLMILLTILMTYLFKKKKIVNQGASTPNFRSGVCILFLIVLIFSLSFPLRIMNDFLTMSKVYG